MDNQEKPTPDENLINADLQNIDAEQRNGSGGIITTIRESIGERLGIAALLIGLGFSVMPSGCEQREKTEEIKTEQTAKAKENIACSEVKFVKFPHDDDNCAERIDPNGNVCIPFGDKLYQRKIKNNSTTYFIDPETLRILRAASGELIVHIYPVMTGFWDEKLYQKVKLEDGRNVFIDTRTFKILRAASGELIIGHLIGDGRIRNKFYTQVKLEDGRNVLIDPKTFKILRAASGELIKYIHSLTIYPLVKFRGRVYQRVTLENNDFALIDPETLEILRTASGEIIQDIFLGIPNKIQFKGKTYVAVVLANEAIVFIDPKTLEILRRRNHRK